MSLLRRTEGDMLTAQAAELDKLIVLANEVLFGKIESCEGCAHWQRLLSTRGKKVTLGECEVSESYTGESSSCPKFLKKA